jgi:S1-C subfamily serine protease
MKYCLLLLLFANSLSAQITLTNNQIGIIETNKGSGSGFIFQKSNLIFTAAHVVNGTTDISYDAIPVRGDRSLSPNFHNLKIIKIDLDFDYAILKSKDSISQQVFYPSPNFNLQIGQLVYYIGFDTVQTIKSKIPTMAIAAARIIKIDSVVIKNKVIKGGNRSKKV